MRPPLKSNTDSSSDATFNNLWVGNLAGDVSDSDLRNLFEKHGVVDTVTCYPSRSYAFVNMRRPDDAKRAKESLQGVVLRGASLKIDFAKPVCIVSLGFCSCLLFLLLLLLLLYGSSLLYVYSLINALSRVSKLSFVFRLHISTLGR